MRISVVFNSDREIVLPVQYNHILQGFMYKNQLDRDYSQFLHQDIKGASNGKFNHLQVVSKYLIVNNIGHVLSPFLYH
jgi:CRISPR/Cas system endoribonuclease Cas6 (RAMP superfamily)